MHPVAKPLDFSSLEEVILVVLDDDLLQLVDLALHPGTQLSLHLQQGLQREATGVDAFQQEHGFFNHQPCCDVAHDKRKFCFSVDEITESA